MKAFIKSLLVISSFLGVVAAGLSRLLPNYHLTPALAGLGLMALNALAAVLILNLPGRDGIRTPILSMAMRLFFLGGIMLLGMLTLKLTQSEALSFVFSAMAGYIVFQALEIRCLVREGLSR